MNRKNFIKVSALSTIAVSNLNAFNFSKNTDFFDKEIIKPQKLNFGDTVGLVSPAGFLSEKGLDESIENMETLGFKVKIGNHV